MTFDGKVSNNTAGSGYVADNTASIQAKIESLANSIPEQTSTKEEKEAAIRIKTEIMDLKKQLYNKALKSGDTESATALLNEIKTIDQEKTVIQSELDAMQSVFDSQNYKKDVSKGGPSIFS